MKRFLYGLSVLLLVTSFVRADSPSTFALSPVGSPLVSLRDFNDARVTSSGGRTVLSLTLSDKAAGRLKEYSRAHVGEPLAIVIDGKVTDAPVIRVPVSGNAFQIDALTAEEANALAALINGQAR